MEEILILKESKIKVKVLIYILLFAIIYGVCNTNVYYADLVPFGVSLIFSLLYVGFNGYILSLIYLAGYILANLNLMAVLEAINVSLVLVLIEYFVSRKNFKLKKWMLFILSIISQIVFIFTHVGNANENLALLISIILGQFFLYSNMCFLNATLCRGMLVKLNLDEKICGCVLIMIFMIGMSYVKVSILNFGLVLAPLIILLAAFMSTSSLAIIVSSLIGISFSLSFGNTGYISLMIVMALCTIAFKCRVKYLSILGIIVGYFIYCIFFGMGISYGEIISVSLGGIIFAFVPLKLIASVADIFNIKSQVILKNIITKSKKQIMKRVEDLSRVFAEMVGVYRNMVKGTLSDDKAIQMLKGELISSLCEDCPNKLACFRGSNSFLENSLDTILSIGYEKGKVLLIDLPSYLTSNCIRINQLINQLNTMLLSYKEYTGIVSNLDMSRTLIADQLSGVSGLLLALSKEVDTNISFESIFENRIKEELSYKDIICLECIIYEKEITDKYISLIVKTDTINDKIIEKIVNRVLNNKLRIKSIEPSEIIGASLINMITAPNYDIAFGSSKISKTGRRVCGDSQSLIKLDDGKFMISICDGMGSGDQARSISRLTINLIENFYRAGFDNEIILNSVNKLLSLTEEENFSTIDLCIIDGRKNIYDFIKLGATTGYLKRNKGECEEINSSGLPVGVLEEISPHITKKLISPFDMLVFVSDGVTDSFENKYDLKMFIDSVSIINPQTLSEEILSKALELNGGVAKDDMTVICVRVFQSV